MSTYQVLQEFLDKNLHRQFPLEDSMTGEDTTGSFQIPTNFMVDLFLYAPPDVNTTLFYVKEIVVRRYTVDVTIGYDGGGAALTVGKFTKIPYNQSLNSVYQFEPTAQSAVGNKPFSIMSGVLVIGSVESILESPGAWSFTSATTKILASRVATGLAAVTSLLIGDQIYTGNIALKEGSGITITPSYDAGLDQTVLTVSADLGTLADLDVPLTSDAAILENLTRLYGTPIVNLNGIKPDSSGNFTLRPLDCTELATITNGLSIENPCSLPCCDKSVLEDVYSSIAELNLRYARMEGYYQSIGRNVNELQSRMIALEL